MDDYVFPKDCRKCKYKKECRLLSDYELTCEEVKRYAENEGYQPV